MVCLKYSHCPLGCEAYMHSSPRCCRKKRYAVNLNNIYSRSSPQPPSVLIHAVSDRSNLMRLGRASCYLCFAVSLASFSPPRRENTSTYNTLYLQYLTYERGGDLVTHLTGTPTGESLISLISRLSCMTSLCLRR